jgi:hypothetical protein
MKLLGHHNANLTLLHVEVTQQDLQREYQAALLPPRHRMPVPPALKSDAASASSADATAVRTAIASALRLMDLYPQLQAPSRADRQIRLLSLRLTRIRSIFEKLSSGPDGEK